MGISCQSPSLEEIKNTFDADILSAKGKIEKIDKIGEEREAAIGAARARITNRYKGLEREADFEAEEYARNIVKKLTKSIDDLLEVNEEWPPSHSFEDLRKINDEVKKWEFHLVRLWLEFFGSSCRYDAKSYGESSAEGRVEPLSQARKRLWELMQRVKDWETLKARYK